MRAPGQVYSIPPSRQGSGLTMLGVTVLSLQRSTEQGHNSVARRSAGMRTYQAHCQTRTRTRQSTALTAVASGGTRTDTSGLVCYVFSSCPESGLTTLVLSLQRAAAKVVLPARRAVARGGEFDRLSPGRYAGHMRTSGCGLTYNLQDVSSLTSVIDTQVGACISDPLLYSI